MRIVNTAKSVADPCLMLTVRFSAAGYLNLLNAHNNGPGAQIMGMQVIVIMGMRRLE